MRAERAGYAETFLGERKTSRCNLAIEISFVPSSQRTFNFSVLRGTQIDFLQRTWLGMLLERI